MSELMLHVFLTSSITILEILGLASPNFWTSPPWKVEVSNSRISRISTNPETLLAGLCCRQWVTHTNLTEST